MQSDMVCVLCVCFISVVMSSILHSIVCFMSLSSLSPARPCPSHQVPASHWPTQVTPLKMPTLCTRWQIVICYDSTTKSSGPRWEDPLLLQIDSDWCNLTCEPVYQWDSIANVVCLVKQSVIDSRRSFRCEAERSKFSYYDLLFESKLSWAVQLADVAYQRTLYREAVKAGFYELQVCVCVCVSVLR